MGAVGVDICDICGKRMPEGKAGNLNLQKKIKSRGYNSLKSQRNWACCKDCLNRLTGIKTRGDLVKDDIEMLIDEHCGKREKKVLQKKIKKAKEVMEVFQ